MQMELENPELSAVYLAASLIAGTREAADESVVSAYAATTWRDSPTGSNERLKLLLREIVVAVKRLPRPERSIVPDVATAGEQRTQLMIRRSLRCLDVDRRAAVVLRDVTGLTRSDAAGALETTPERYRQLLSEGRLMLTERMT